MQPKLQFTCPVRWEDMRVGITGRHCFQCDKEVVDFTSGTNPRPATAADYDRLFRAAL